MRQAVRVAGAQGGRSERGLLYGAGVIVFVALAVLPWPTWAARWVFPCVAAVWVAAVVWERRRSAERRPEAWGLADELRLAVIFLVVGLLASLAIAWLSALPGSNALG